MFRRIKSLLVAGALALSFGSAQAQAPIKNAAPVYNTYFQVGRATDINVTTASFDEALPSTGSPVATVFNTGSNYAYVKLSNSVSTVTAANGTPIPPGSCAFLTAGSASHIQAITATNTTTLQISLGWGSQGSCGGAGGGGGGGSGAVFGPTAAGSAAANPPVLVGGTSDGTGTGLMSAWKVLSGIGFINCANCSGTGVSVGFGASIGAVGTPGGYKDGSGNFQPLLGDVTNGQWVSIKSSVSLPVTGTFWQATQPISGSVSLTGTLPAFAATPTFNIGTAPSLTVSGTVTANAGTNLNTSALALETGGNLANLYAATGSGASPAANTLQSRLATINTTLGTPFQAGGSIGNTSFGISGTLPAFASTPTVNLGTIGGAATQTTLASVLTALGTPFQAGGSIGNTVFGATQSGTWNITNISGTISLPTGAATSANQPTNAAQASATAGQTGHLVLGAVSTSAPTYTNAESYPLSLTTAGALRVSDASVVTALGTPFQAGGSIGNTTFASTQSGTWNVGITGNATVVQPTGTNLHVVCDSGCSSSSSPSFGGAFPSTGTPIGMSQGGLLTALTGTSGNLNVQCANCSGSGASASDEAAFTAGSSVLAPSGGFFQTTATSNPLTTGQQGMVQMTAQRAFFVNPRNSSGVEIGTASTPIQVSLANTTTNATAVKVDGSAVTQPISAASLPLPTGAATQTTLASVLTALGSPFQAGGSIGNASFGATQATAANLNATVVGTGTFAVQASQTGTWTVNPATAANWGLGATASAVPANAQYVGMSVAGTLTGLTGTANGLKVDGSAVTQPVSGTVTFSNSTIAVTQATAASLNATVVGTGTFAVQASQSGTWNIGSITTLPALVAGSAIIGKVGIDQTTPGTTNLVSIGTNGTVNPTTAANWGIGTSTQNSATVANGALVLGQFNTTPTTITSGNMSPLQMDNAGNLLVNIKAGSSSGAVAQGSTTSGQSGGLTQAAALSSTPTYTTGTTNPLTTDLNGNLRVTVAAAVGLTQGSTTSGQTGSLIMGAVTTSAPSYTTAQTSPISLDTAGNLRINCVTGCGGGSGGTASNFGSAFPTQGTAIGLTNGTNMVAWSATSNYGTAPSAIAVPAVNAAVTNSVTIGTLPALVAGSAIIGKVGIDQTTPGTTNGTQDASTGSTGSAVPAKSIYVGAVSSGNLTGIIQADTSVAINISTATTTQLVALSAGKKIYVTALDVVAGGTGNITFEYGTGTACATGTTVLTGAYNLTAQSGLAKGGGLGPVLVVPAGNALCALTSAAVQMSGSAAYTQF